MIRSVKIVSVVLGMLSVAGFAGRCLAAEAKNPAPWLAGACASSSPVLPAAAPLPSFLASETDPAVLCRCGDAACNGQAPGSHCGSPVRVCLSVGSCPLSATTIPTRNCACVTQDPLGGGH